MSGLAFFVLNFFLSNVRAEGAENEVIFIPESGEIVLDIFQILLSLVIAILSVSLAKTFKGSKLEKGWIFIIVGSMIWVLKELTEIISELADFLIVGLEEFLEIAIIVAFIIAIVTIANAYKLE